ncbi:MAG: GTPase domain-containing protein [Candidatus Zixiibacteriota bacterium]
MKFSKIFRFFKKGAKAAAKHKGKGAAAKGAYEWPSGIRIGVVGHFNSGKTVYFTVLNEECKFAKNIQIAVTDTATAGEFLTNYRHIWGMGTATGVGTVVDLKEERKFPDPTKGDKVLQFSVILDRKKKLPIVTYDYDGKAIAISGDHELSEKVLDFMSGCDGILFFYDPKMLGAELESQAHVSSFVNVLECLAPLGRRLPIPIALVVTKADILDGFSSETQSILISGEDESILAEDFEVFLERILNSHKVASNSAWAGTVRNVLVKLKEFLKVVVSRTLNFQIFFVSATGQTPEKIGTDVGRSIYAPPPKITPIGVKEPFYWILNSIRRSRKISAIRRVAKYAAVLSLIWIGLFSLPYLLHFKYLLPKASGFEDRILQTKRRSSATPQEQKDISAAYARYRSAWTVRTLFPSFITPTEEIRSIYGSDILSQERRRLNEIIRLVATTVRDTANWPIPDPSGDSLFLTPSHKQLEENLADFHRGDSTSELFTRSDRALTLWNLFKAALKRPNDSAAWKKVVEQVDNYNRYYGNDLSKEENELGMALTDIALGRKEKEQKKETVAQAGREFDQLVEQINANPDPEYRLGTAVVKLKKLSNLLKDNPDRAPDVERIDRYLQQAKYFEKNRKYTFKVQSCPQDHHIHIRVTGRGKTANWIHDQFRPGNEFSITWRSGDTILVALHEDHPPKEGENWGEKYKELKELDKPFSIFQLNGTVNFNAGGVTASCQDDLMAKLPKL